MQTFGASFTGQPICEYGATAGQRPPNTTAFWVSLEEDVGGNAAAVSQTITAMRRPYSGGTIAPLWGNVVQPSRQKVGEPRTSSDGLRPCVVEVAVRGPRGGSSVEERERAAALLRAMECRRCCCC